MVSLWSFVINKRCLTLETAEDLKTVILSSKVNGLMMRNFYFANMFAKIFILFKIFIIRKMNTKYFYGFVIKINTFYATKYPRTPLEHQYPQFYIFPNLVLILRNLKRYLTHSLILL